MSDTPSDSSLPTEGSMRAPGLSLKGRALRLLSQREHTQQELARKLAPHAQSPEQLQQLIGELMQAGWLSHERYIESVIHRRAAKLGASRLRQELQGKGISGGEMAEALEQLRHTEEQRARAVWTRRFGNPPVDARDHARQLRFLMSRGFSTDVIRRVLRASDVHEASD
jgi:regulatory protein